LVFLHAESSIHPGTGAAAGVVDLPIQRAVHTGWPIVYDSTLKGAFKRHLSSEAASHLLGHEQGSGKVSIPDAELLLFPLASAKGVTAWITCPRALRDCKRQLDLVAGVASGETLRALSGLGTVVGQVRTGPDHVGQVWVHGDALLWSADGDDYVLLGEDRFIAPKDDGQRNPRLAAKGLVSWLEEFACVHGADWTSEMTSRVVIMHDDAFTHFVNSRTEIRTRIVIKDGKANNLWTEENLPVETLLYTTAAAIEGSHLTEFLDEAKLKTDDTDARPVMQLGGDQGLGRGWFRMRALWKGEASK